MHTWSLLPPRTHLLPAAPSWLHMLSGASRGLERLGATPLLLEFRVRGQISRWLPCVHPEGVPWAPPPAPVQQRRPGREGEGEEGLRPLLGHREPQLSPLGWDVRRAGTRPWSRLPYGPQDPGWRRCSLGVGASTAEGTPGHSPGLDGQPVLTEPEPHATPF